MNWNEHEYACDWDTGNFRAMLMLEQQEETDECTQKTTTKKISAAKLYRI